MSKANIFDIERNSFVDGPGIRTTVFFKGCNLHCTWCHNPESQSPEKQLMLYKNKCASCGRCKNVSADDESFICFNDAREICGKDYTVDEVFNEIKKDKCFYDNSDGGVTFSGGECMLQIDFLCKILKKCKKNGIHTAVDTAGHIPWQNFEKILPYTDLFLYDIKSMDSDIHKKHTGAGNELILENLARLLSLKLNIWVRVPVIPTINDSEDMFERMKNLFDNIGYPQKIELLPYHAMGEHKYDALGKSAQKFDIPDKERMKIFKKLLSTDM